MIGTTLGQYKLLDEIGRGGMGVVYLAEHVELGARYALKLLPEELSISPAFIQRFKTEARIMARLNHPGVVRVFNLGSAGERYFLVMDLVLSPDGQPKHLGHLIEEGGGKLSPDETRDVVLQICDALHYAHTYVDDLVKEGVVHRDLKPANVLLDSMGRMRVSDFGLAKIIGGDFILSRISESFSRSVGDRQTQAHPAEGASIGGQPTVPQGSPHTSDEAILGTYDYMSPEQKDPRRAAMVDRRSDIFSLGVIAYRMLTGRKPEGFFELPSRLDASIPAVWDELLGRALRPDADDRFASVDEVAEVLAHGRGGAAGPPVAPVSTEQRDAGRREHVGAPSQVQAEAVADEAPEADGGHCDLCGWPLEEDDLVCGGCGEKTGARAADAEPAVPSDVQTTSEESAAHVQRCCDACGAALDENDAFCPDCGERIPRGEL